MGTLETRIKTSREARAAASEARKKKKARKIIEDRPGGTGLDAAAERKIAQETQNQ